MSQQDKPTQTMSKFKMFVYDWFIQEEFNDLTIRIYGLNEKNETFCLNVFDFTPYVYLELPFDIEWTDAKIKQLCNKLKEKMSERGQRFNPVQKVLMNKKKLYYCHFDKGTKDATLYPFLFLSFYTVREIYQLKNFVKNALFIPGIGRIVLKLHEYKANPILQLTSLCNIPTIGWIRGVGEVENIKETECDYEYIVQWKNIKPSKCTEFVDPLIMAFDIEVYSSVAGSMPSYDNPNDKVFQVSCVFARYSDSEEKYKRFLISLGKPNQDIVSNGLGGEDDEKRPTTVIAVKNEAALLEAFKDIVKEYKPQILIGYNIMGFDIEYMVNRAKLNFVLPSFDKIGCMDNNHALVKTTKWSSSAHHSQNFFYMNMDGRITMDLFFTIKKEYSFAQYKLKFVCDYFLGVTKDPLTAQDIFACYEEFTPKSLGVVGRYCVQDSHLTMKLFQKLSYWEGFSEMAKICNVSIPMLYLNGTQLRMFSQLYRICFKENYVVESDAYTSNSDGYSGAYVMTPVPGVYENVVPFDFSSLYPSIIIAFNICFTTFVNEEENGKEIKDSDCHLFDWEEHINCEHDPKPKKATKKKITVVCTRYRFRFLKEPQGILPRLLINLLDARKTTRNTIKTIKKDEKMDVEFKKKYLIVLDKRQLAYKINANAAYGALGTPQGYLPLMPGAMCITARGRESIGKMMKFLPEKYGIKVVYGDTDSTYLQIPNITTVKDIWEYSRNLEKHLEGLFPKPMKMAFEDKIFKRFMIFKKKKYIAVEIDENGKEKDDIEKKGVILKRRDNSKCQRDIYYNVVMMMFNKASETQVLTYLLDFLEKMFTFQVDPSEFIVTKSIKDKSCYKARALPSIPTEREKKLQAAKCKDEEEFAFRSLPAHIQLVEKIKSRGTMVELGSRLGFVLTKHHDLAAKQFNKLEDYDYFKQFSTILRLDILAYVKLFILPIDQALEIAFPRNKTFMKLQHKFRLQKEKVLYELKMCVHRTIISISKN